MDLLLDSSRLFHPTRPNSPSAARGNPSKSHLAVDRLLLSCIIYAHGRRKPLGALSVLLPGPLAHPSSSFFKVLLPAPPREQRLYHLVGKRGNSPGSRPSAYGSSCTQLQSRGRTSACSFRCYKHHHNHPRMFVLPASHSPMLPAAMRARPAGRY